MQMSSPVTNMLSLKVRGLLEHPHTHCWGEKVLVCATVYTHETSSQWGKHGL